MLESGLEVVYGGLVGLVVTVREVEARDVHAGVNHFNEHIDIPAGWPEGANDFGSALGDVDGFEDV